jgi:hypothetical protein
VIYFKELGDWGRMCNQFFQVASTVGHALKYNDIAIFPHWKYNEFLKGIKTDDISNFNIIYNYIEPSFSYSEIPYISGMNLGGYFQSEKYFSHCKSEIREIISLKSDIKINLINKWKDLLINSVSIHVRRTDYLTKQHYHPCPTIDYFLEGIKIVRSKFKVDNILVFSDDIEWCKNNFKNDNFIFVENQQEYEDVFLMSFCEHNIISNSSFSWWASWLNNNEEKIIIAPKQWFGKNLPILTKDLFLDNMILL